MSKTRKPAKRSGKSSARKSSVKSGVTVKSKTKGKARASAKVNARSSGSLIGFALPWMKSENKDFSSNFKFGNFSGTVERKGKTVTINVSIEGKNCDFDGVFSMNEKAFKNLQKIFDHVLDNLN